MLHGSLAPVRRSTRITLSRRRPGSVSILLMLIRTCHRQLHALGKPSSETSGHGECGCPGTPGGAERLVLHLSGRRHRSADGTRSIFGVIGHGNGGQPRCGPGGSPRCRMRGRSRSRKRAGPLPPADRSEARSDRDVLGEPQCFPHHEVVRFNLLLRKPCPVSNSHSFRHDGIWMSTIRHPPHNFEPACYNARVSRCTVPSQQGSYHDHCSAHACRV